MWGTDWTRAIGMLTYEQGVAPFRDTKRLSESDKAALMGGTCRKSTNGDGRRRYGNTDDHGREDTRPRGRQIEYKAGEFLDCKLDGLMAYQGFVETHHNAQAVGLADGLPKVFDRRRCSSWWSITSPPPISRWPSAACSCASSRSATSLENFYDTTCGICHQMMVDKAHALPGHLVVGTDSHSIMYGALNCASTGIGETDSGYAFTFGELWFQVPESHRDHADRFRARMADRQGHHALPRGQVRRGHGALQVDRIRRTRREDAQHGQSLHDVRPGRGDRREVRDLPSRRCDARVPRRSGRWRLYGAGDGRRRCRLRRALYARSLQHHAAGGRAAQLRKREAGGRARRHSHRPGVHRLVRQRPLRGHRDRGENPQGSEGEARRAPADLPFVVGRLSPVSRGGPAGGHPRCGRSVPEPRLRRLRAERRVHGAGRSLHHRHHAQRTRTHGEARTLRSTSGARRPSHGRR